MSKLPIEGPHEMESAERHDLSFDFAAWIKAARLTAIDSVTAKDKATGASVPALIAGVPAPAIKVSAVQFRVDASQGAPGGQYRISIKVTDLDGEKWTGLLDVHIIS